MRLGMWCQCNRPLPQLCSLLALSHAGSADAGQVAQLWIVGAERQAFRQHIKGLANLSAGKQSCGSLFESCCVVFHARSDTRWLGDYVANA